MANQLEAMQNRVNQRAEVSMNLMSSQMSAMLANFNKSMKASSDTLASGVKNILESSDNFITPLANTSNMARTLTKLLSQTDTQFVVPLLNGNNLTQQLKKLESSGGGSEKLPESQKQETLPDVTKAKPELPGMWQSFKDGSLRDMWRNLISDISQFKGVVAMTTVIVSAFNREVKINELRVMTDGLEKGSKSLDSFKTIVADVAVQTGMNFNDIAERAANVKKYFDLTFDSTYFREYLKVQTLLTKSTDLSDNTLNKLFLSIRMGTRDEESWIRMTKDMSSTLVALSGKTGINKDTMKSFADDMVKIKQYVQELGGSTEAVEKLTIQWSNIAADFGKEGLGALSDRLRWGFANFRDDPKAFEFLFSDLLLNREKVEKGLREGNIEGLVMEGMATIKERARQAMTLSPNVPGGMKDFLKNILGGDEELSRALRSAWGAGKIDPMLNELRSNINKKIVSTRTEDIMSSVTKSLNSLKESFHNILMDIGEGPLAIIASAMKKISGLAKEWNTAFQALPESTRTLVGTLGAIVIGITAALPIIGAITTAIGGLGAMSLAIGGTGFFASILAGGPVVVGLGLVAGAIALVASNWDTVKTALSENGLKEFATDIENTTTGIKSLAVGLKDLGASIVDYFKSINDSYPMLKKLDEWTVSSVKRLLWAASGGELLSNIGKAEKDFGKENTASGWWSRAKAGIYSALGRKDLIQEEQDKQKWLKESHTRGDELVQSSKSSLLPNLRLPLIPDNMLVESKVTMASGNILQSLQSLASNNESINQNLKSIQETNKSAIEETYKANQPTPTIEKQKVEPSSSTGEVKVENFNEFLELAKKYFDLYLSDRNKPDSNRTPRLMQPMTYSEAQSDVDYLTHNNGSWGHV